MIHTITSSQIIQMYVLCIDRDPYRLQVLAVWAIAEDTVNQPNPSVKPHASDAMTKSSLVTSSRTNCGGRYVFISKRAGLSGAQAGSVRPYTSSTRLQERVGGVTPEHADPQPQD